MKRPHVILIMSDQQKASATSMAGNPFARTPTWQKIAEEGVVFEQAYSQSPICTPSRATMMTGTYPLVHQVLCHQNHAPGNLRQLPEFMAEEGYRCIGAGHIESTRSLTAGWHDQLDMLSTPRLNDAFRAHYGCGSREVGWSAGESSVSPELGHAAVLNDELFARLDKIDPAAAPWFLHVAYIEPHPPYFAPRGYLDEAALREALLPEVGRMEDRPAWHAAMLQDYASAQAGPAEIRRLLAAYYGMIRYVDEQMARLLEYLDRRGVLEDAWVILTSDHGDYAGEKGFYTKSEAAYECLLHVPLVIRGPRGQWHPGRRVDSLVELIDLFSTILSLAGRTAPPQAQGYDLIGWLDHARAPLREATFSAVGAYGGNLKTTMPHGLPESGRRKGIVRAARSRTHAFIRDPDTGDEVYDLVKDPLELRELRRSGATMPPPVTQLERSLAEWEERCVAHGKFLGVEPGQRNFDEPVKLTGAGMK